MLNKIASKYLEKRAGVPDGSKEVAKPKFTDEDLYKITGADGAPTVGYVTPEQAYKRIFPKDMADRYYQRMQDKRREQFGEDAKLIPQDAVPTIYTGEGKATTPYINNKSIPVKQPDSSGRGFFAINPNTGIDPHHIVVPKYTTPFKYTEDHETVHPGTLDASLDSWDPSTVNTSGSVPRARPDTIIYKGDTIPTKYINPYDLPLYTRLTDPRYNPNKLPISLDSAEAERLKAIYGDNYGDFFTYFGVPSEFNTTAANIKGIVANKGMNFDDSHDFKKVGEFIYNIDPGTLDDTQKRFIEDFNQVRNQLRAYEQRIQYLESLDQKDAETQEILEHLKGEYETFKQRYETRFDLANNNSYNMLSNQGLGIG